MSTAPDTVVLLASTPYAGHQLYDQRLARALAAERAVVYVDPPVPVFGLGKPGPPPPHRRSVDGVTVLAPRMLPFGRRRGLATLTGLWVGLLARHAGRRAPGVPGVLVTSAHPVSLRLLRGWRSELLLKDDYVAGAALIRGAAGRIARHRRQLLRGVDAVAVVSPVLAEAAAAMGAPAEVHVVPPGCDPGAGRVDVAALLAAVPGPRAVFIGMVSDRIDVDLLAATCAAGVTVVVVGRQQATFSQQDRWACLVATGRLVLLGERTPDVVASLVAACDVALVPYTQSDFNRACFPLKLLEYLAAGTPVVASDLPAVRWLDAPHVHLVADAVGLPAALAAALADAADPATTGRCRDFAAGHTWADRARRHVALLGG
ncbi:glycosyltransferase family 1 protein [Geodermatophilaceae bacterium NBWT11]|nr:glycosyltransferase family 1 protein [Geodermatophilaceae bacterium NBWT11]